MLFVMNYIMFENEFRSGDCLLHHHCSIVIYCTWKTYAMSYLIYCIDPLFNQEMWPFSVLPVSLSL